MAYSIGLLRHRYAPQALHLMLAAFNRFSVVFAYPSCSHAGHLSSHGRTSFHLRHLEAERSR